MDYYHESLEINNRNVRIQDILNDESKPSSEFEFETFSFIKQWMSGQEKFTFHTSGSTGASKVILFKRDQLIQSANSTISALDLSSQDIALVCLNPKFIAGKMMLVRSFVHNMKVLAIEPSSNPLDKLNFDQKIDFAAFIPLQLQTMIDTGAYARLNKIKSIIVGGSPILQPLLIQIGKHLRTDLHETYGMTETISHIAFKDISRSEDHFKLLPRIQISTDERNCLIIKCPYLETPVHTNDLVDMASDNTFRWIGRYDNVINSGGIKVVPEPIENEIGKIFTSLNINFRFFVAGIPDLTFGNKVVLFIEGTMKDKEATQILERVRNSVPPFHSPRKIIPLNRFKSTKTGKINRPETLKSYLNLV